MLFGPFKVSLVYNNRAYELHLPWDASEAQVKDEIEKLRRQMELHGQSLPLLKVKRMESDAANQRLLVFAETDE